MNSASLHFLPEATRGMAGAAESGAGSRERWPVAVLGVPLHPLSVSTAVDQIVSLVERRRHGCVLAATLAFVLGAGRDAELQRAAQDADFVVCDSARLVLASRWLGNPLPRAIRANALTEHLLAIAAVRQYRVFLVGPHPGATVRIAAGFQRAVPRLKLAGTYSPVLFDPTDRDVLQRLASDASADLVLGCFDDIDQQKWLASAADGFAAPVVVVSAASQPSLAPKTTSAEPWTHAISRRIDRWRKIARTTLELLPALLRQRIATPLPSTSSPVPPSITNATGDWLHVEAGTDLTHSAIEDHADCWRRAAGGRHCTIDLSRVRRIDATGVALLSQQRTARRRERHELVLVSPTNAVVRALATAHLVSLFTVAASIDEARQLVAAQRAPSPQQDGLTRSLAWCGEIIAANVDDVWQMTSGYMRTFAAAGATLIVIDLARLRFIDGAGAALMYRVKKWARELKTEVLFANPGTAVTDVLRLAQVDRLLLEGAQ